jgi:hypothetical protein
MIVKNDFSAWVVVAVILIVVICAFGFLLSDRVAGRDSIEDFNLDPMSGTFGPKEPTRWAVTPSPKSNEEDGVLTSFAGMSIDPTSTPNVQETQIAGLNLTATAQDLKSKENAIHATATSMAIAAINEAKAAEQENMLRMSLPALLIGIVVTGIVATIIIAIAIADRFRNEAALRQQEIEYHRLIEQRRLAELRAAEIKARRVREGAVRALSAVTDVQTSRTNGNGHKRYANSRWPVD